MCIHAGLAARYHEQTVVPPYPWRLRTKFGFKLIGKAVPGEVVQTGPKNDKNSPTFFLVSKPRL